MGARIYSSMQVTMPVFLMMVLGIAFRRAGWISERFAAEMNRFVFKIALPVSLFWQIAQTDFWSVWDGRYVLLCFIITAAEILIAILLSRLIRERSVRGEFVQAAYRSSTALLGMTYLMNAYGSAAVSALMIIGSVPLYNVAAVLILSGGGGNTDRPSGRKMAKDVVTNPIILGVLAGFLISFLRVPIPEIPGKCISSLASLASPLGLLAMGASIDFRRLGGHVRAILGASALKLVGFSALFLPLAVMAGFRQEKLMAVLIMTGSASTVAGYTMARSFGCGGEVSAGSVMLTTLLTSVTLTFWIFLLQTGGYL